MKKLLIVLIAVLLHFSTGSVSATIVNPNPVMWGNDNGSETFSPGLFAGTVELYDILGGLGAGTTFGFYFIDNPGDLITVFDPADQTMSGNVQSATINFGTGVVRDADAGFSLQDLFPVSTSDIGFFLSIETLAGIDTIYTEHVLNPLLLDLSATFPSWTDPDQYLIGFENSSTLYFGLVNGVTSAVPEPSTLVLFAVGVIGGGWFYVRKRKLT
jgi:hypothetical protein